LHLDAWGPCRSGEPEGGNSQFAWISTTGDPHVLAFRVDGLELGLYHLALARISEGGDKWLVAGKDWY
jgi:hypothetical protein